MEAGAQIVCSSLALANISLAVKSEPEIGLEARSSAASSELTKPTLVPIGNYFISIILVHLLKLSFLKHFIMNEKFHLL